MNVIFRPTDYRDELVCSAIAEWENDSELRRFWVPAMDGAEALPPVTPAEIKARNTQIAGAKPDLDEVAFLGDRIVGKITIILNPPHKRLAEANVAWPSLIIGEKSLRGSGIVRRFGQRIIAKSLALGATHLEVGTFEFNQPIRGLLQRSGFREFTRVPGITWREGRAWDDVRYEKKLR